MSKEKKANKTLKDAGEEYAEIWGEQMHTNRHLRVLTVGLGLFALLLIIVVIRHGLGRSPQADCREGG